MKVGLRIDVDTFRGTRYGVPRLCSLLAEHGILASFFFSVGPDNMGRHLWRLLRPAFLRKMWRSRAASLYGWDILLRGTFWPGPVISEKLAPVLRAAAEAGHETGLHAWDHHAWQTHLDRMSADELRCVLKKSVDQFTRTLGIPPICSAAPAWQCNDLALIEKALLPFKYNSDCRGRSIFYPVVNGEELTQPQIPVTLPTYDEIIGREGVTESNYNDYLLSLLKPRQLNVLTIHAEVEGIIHLDLFQRFIRAGQSKGVVFVPLGTLLPDSALIERGKIARRSTAGRDGWVARQEPVN